MAYHSRPRPSDAFGGFLYHPAHHLQPPVERTRRFSLGVPDPEFRKCRQSLPSFNQPQTCYGLGTGYVSVVKANDYMMLSIVSCFFCLPLGLIAVCLSIKSRNKYHIAEFERAKRLGNIARIVAVFAIIVGVGIFFLISFILLKPKFKQDN